MLAKIVNDNAGNLTPSGALRFLASKLGSYKGLSFPARRPVPSATPIPRILR